MKRVIHDSATLLGLLTACVAAQVFGSLGCASHKAANQTKVQTMANAQADSSDAELMAQIKTFSEDVGPVGEAAGAKLRSYPRDQLIQKLRAWRKKFPDDDGKQYQIAFVLCMFGDQYDLNAKKIVSAFATTSKPDNYADTAAMMVGRLIASGHNELLKVLFDAAPSSDASLAEALADVFGQQLRSNTSSFLIQLKEEPPQTRTRIYGLIQKGGLNQKELQELRLNLQALSRQPEISEVAKEVLASQVFKP